MFDITQCFCFLRSDALEKNQDMEFERNKERFIFLKVFKHYTFIEMHYSRKLCISQWGAQNFKNMLVVPPGSGIVHQVNLEYLARVVFNQDGLLYPDSVVGTDSHTTMINGLGVVGWGVGGIEAEAVMLGSFVFHILLQIPSDIVRTIFLTMHHSAILQAKLFLWFFLR